MTAPLTSRQLYLRLLGYVRPHWRVFGLGIVGMVALAATEPLFPALMKPLLDKGFSGQARDDLWIAPLAIVGIFLLRGFLSFVTSYLMSWVANRIVMDLRVAMFERMLTLPTRYYDDQSTGALISRVTYDVANVTSAATSVLTVAVRDSLAVVGLLAWLFYLNWKLTLVALTIGPVIAIVQRGLAAAESIFGLLDETPEDDRGSSFWRLMLQADEQPALAGACGLMLVIGVVMRNQFNDLFTCDRALRYWALVGIFLGQASRLSWGQRAA